MVQLYYDKYIAKPLRLPTVRLGTFFLKSQWVGVLFGVLYGPLIAREVLLWDGPWDPQDPYYHSLSGTLHIYCPWLLKSHWLPQVSIDIYMY